MSELRLERTVDKKGEHRAHVIAANGETIWATSEGYKDPRDLDHSIDLTIEALAGQLIARLAHFGDPEGPWVPWPEGPEDHCFYCEGPTSLEHTDKGEHRGPVPVMRHNVECPWVEARDRFGKDWPKGNTIHIVGD